MPSAAVCEMSEQKSNPVLSGGALADLENSGLTMETIREMGVEDVDYDNLKEYHFDTSLYKHGAYLIPYLCIEGDNKFGRIKITVPNGSDVPKYLSPAKDRVNYPVHLYMLPRDYEKLGSPKTQIVFTEGEKKAAKLSQTFRKLDSDSVKYSAVGLGGVCMYNSPEFRSMPLKDKKVYIAFDADSETNSNVAKAEIKFYAELVKRGVASVSSLHWDKDYGKGIDDYLVLSPDRSPEMSLYKLISEARHPLEKYADILKLETVCEQIAAAGNNEDAAKSMFIAELTEHYKPKGYTKKDIVNIFEKKLKLAESAANSKMYEDRTLETLSLLGVGAECKPPYPYVFNGDKLFVILQNTPKMLCRAFVFKELLHTDSSERKDTLILKFSDKELAIPSDYMSSPQDLCRYFSANKELVDLSSAKHICEYISVYYQVNRNDIKEMRLMESTGWYEDKKSHHFALPTYNGEVRYSAEIEGKYTMAGNNEKQVAFISEKVLTQKAGIVIPLCLAATLVKPFGLQNVIVNFNGTSGCGKTTAALIGLSLFGNPGVLKGNFNKTAFAYEQSLSLSKDIPVLVDEANTAGKDETKIRDTLLELVYNFESGQGRTRGTKECKLRETATYSGMVMITAEISMDSLLDTGYQARDSKGVYRRVLEVRSTELWNNADWKEIYSGISTDYGHIAPLWLDYLREQGGLGAIEEHREKNLALLNNGSYSLKGKEDFLSLALSVLDCLNRLFSITKDTLEMLRDTLLEIAKDNSDVLQEKLLNPVERFVETFNNYVIENKSCFGYTDAFREPRAVFGVYEGGEVKILTHKFDEFCRANKFDKTSILKLLAQEGILRKSREDRNVSEFRRDTLKGSGYILRTGLEEPEVKPVITAQVAMASRGFA